MTCEVCEGAGWDWKRAADEDLQVDDPVDYYPCPVMVDGKHPVEHDGAECWHCGVTDKEVET